MTPAFQFDTREFTASLRLYEKATQKDEVEIVNRSARNIVLRAMQFTPKATPAKIRAELRGMESRKFFRIVNAARKKKGLPAVNGIEMRDAAKKFVGKRASSAGYIRAGWIPAAEKLGIKVLGRVSRKGNAGKGYAITATTTHRVAEVVNTANASLKIGSDALNRAFSFVAGDMRSYAEKKLSGTARKFSTK